MRCNLTKGRTQDARWALGTVPPGHWTLVAYCCSALSALVLNAGGSHLTVQPALLPPLAALRTSGTHQPTTIAPRNGLNLAHMLPHQLLTSHGAGDDFTFTGLNTALKSLACHLNGTNKSAVPRPRVISVISDGVDHVAQPFLN